MEIKDIESGSAEPAGDPSGSARQGYVAATRGRPVSGHLAWERIGGRFTAARRRALASGRSFDDHRMAWVMGYGLGLQDGARGEAESTDSMDVVLPWLSSPRPVYNSARFWLSVSG